MGGPGASLGHTVGQAAGWVYFAGSGYKLWVGEGRRERAIREGRLAREGGNLVAMGRGGSSRAEASSVQDSAYTYTSPWGLEHADEGRGRQRDSELAQGAHPLLCPVTGWRSWAYTMQITRCTLDSCWACVTRSAFRWVSWVSLGDGVGASGSGLTTSACACRPGRLPRVQVCALRPCDGGTALPVPPSPGEQQYNEGRPAGAATTMAGAQAEALHRQPFLPPGLAPRGRRHHHQTQPPRVLRLGQGSGGSGWPPGRCCSYSPTTTSHGFTLHPRL